MNKEGISFNTNTPIDGNKGYADILSARRQTQYDALDFEENDIKTLNKQYEDLIKNAEEYLEKSKSIKNIYIDLERVHSKLAQDVSGQTSDYDDSLKNAKEELKIMKELLKVILKIKAAEAETKEERKDIIDSYNSQIDLIDSQIDDLDNKLNNLKTSNKSAFEAFGKELKSFKDDLAQLNVVKSVTGIEKGLGLNKTYNAYNAMRSQYGMSYGDFNRFNRGVASQVWSEGNMFKYGYNDALQYMEKLAEIGITDQDIARDMLNEIMEGTKFLGISTETQAKIYKLSRQTGNMDLLNQHNKTIVQLMNAQLGISKEQLDKISSQAADMATLATMYSGNPLAMESFTKSSSALTSMYGEGAAQGAQNIAADLLQNGANSQYAAILGPNYQTILAKLQAGDGSALYDIIQAVQNSSISQAAGQNADTYAALTNAGYFDSNTLGIVNAQNQSGMTYDQTMNKIESSSNDTSEFIKKIKQPLTEMLGNAVSWIQSIIPLQGLETLYYTMAITYMGMQMAMGVGKILKEGFPKLLKWFPQLTKGTSNVTSLLGASNSSGIGGMLAKWLPSIGKFALKGLGVGLIIGGVAAGVVDAVKATQKADEWGTSKGSAAVGGFLGGSDSKTSTRLFKNAAKFAAIGAGIGLLVGGPPGLAIGAVIGCLAGLVLGSIGGQNISEGLDKFLGINKKEEGTGSAIAPVFSTPSSSSHTGKGELMKKSQFPWAFTSPFGYRGVIQTSAGPTNPFHSGIDLASSEGTPIGANRAGTVSGSGTANDGANYVIINDGMGYEQIYWHLMKPSHLKRGDKVNLGQLIGYMGKTGHATGPHLHFGHRKAGTTDYVDPINTVDSAMFTPTDDGIPASMPNIDTFERSQQLLQSVVSADTMSKEAQAMYNTGIGDEGSDKIVNSVNVGFGSLINKLDELSARQDNQEQMLRALASGSGSRVYKI